MYVRDACKGILYFCILFMNYKNTSVFAAEMDEQDPLKDFRSMFLIPNHNNKQAIYFCGNSLGLQPETAQQHVAEQLKVWQEIAIEGFFQGESPWLGYHKSLTKTLAVIVGANDNEVSVMNSLTVNLHLLMVSFYKPDVNKYKILMEGGAFPSDQYAIESQLRFHGFNPKDALIEVFPREGEHTLRTEDILKIIRDNARELSVVLFGGINYFTGQFFDIAAITEAAHEAGAIAGFDLAHAAGNVELQLHNWNADFAVWCSYKYMNSGPGGVSGIFVNEKHFNNEKLNRFAGWWGYKETERFKMTPGFIPDFGAAGWQVSTSPVILLALHKASLEIFQKAGGMSLLNEKSRLLTGYLEYIISDINNKYDEELYKIITPKNQQERGCQLSIVCKKNAKQIFNFLADNGIVGDWREPNVIRLSPVPLYNTFKEVYQAGLVLNTYVKENLSQGL